MKKIIFIIAAFLVLSSCETVNNIKSKLGKKQESVVNTQWVLVDGNLGTTKAPTLILENARVTGNGSCNNYFGELSMDASIGSFKAKNIGATKMACENMMVEQNYFNMLENVNKYLINNGNLELYKDNLLLLKFRKL